MMQIGSSAFWLTIVSLTAVSVIFGVSGGFAASNGGATGWEAVEAGFRRFGGAMILGILFATFIVAIGAANAALEESQKDCRPSAAAVLHPPTGPVRAFGARRGDSANAVAPLVSGE